MVFSSDKNYFSNCMILIPLYKPENEVTVLF